MSKTIFDVYVVYRKIDNEIVEKWFQVIDTLDPNEDKIYRGFYDTVDSFIHDLQAPGYSCCTYLSTGFNDMPHLTSGRLCDVNEYGQEVEPEEFLSLLIEYLTEDIMDFEKEEREDAKITDEELQSGWVRRHPTDVTPLNYQMLIKQRDGYISTTPALASNFRWNHKGVATDIMGYKFVPPLEEQQVKEGVKTMLSNSVTLETFSLPYGEEDDIKNNPSPRYRKRRQRPSKQKKDVVRVIYTDQSVYTFKNPRQVQIVGDKIFIAYERHVADGIVEKAEVEIDAQLAMGVVVKGKHPANLLRNIDNTWEYINANGVTVVNYAQITLKFKTE